MTARRTTTNALLVLLLCGLPSCGGSGGGGVTFIQPRFDATAIADSTPALPVMPTTTIPAPAANVLRVSLGRGPNKTAFNAPYVAVTLCVPGTDLCQTLDHVLVDTGSVGLRIAASALRADLPLPPVTVGGAPVGECMQFASGYAWGSVRQADLRLSGERAASIPVQVIDETGPVFGTVPAACARSGINLMQLLDAKAVLGLGMHRQDCGSACATSGAPGIYFACGPGGCATTALPLEQQVGNPVPAFERNNNGVVIVLPQVSLGGSAQLEGALVFGIGTQANNQMGAAKVFDVDTGGNFSTRYKGTAYRSFLDTGSNAVYFPDTDLPRCGTYFCPFLVTALSATITSPRGITGNVDFLIDSLYGLRTEAVAAHTAGPDGGALAQSFNWGLPFFFGRSVHLAIQDAPTPAGRGPYWAF
jgi:hypothetical protein